MTELEDYKRKRNFEESEEPRGEISKNQEDFHFAIQHHLARREHFDFRLEWKGVLLSWAVPKGPTFDTDEKRLAVRVEDHPLDYRNFEGTIPKGQYGGGTVMLWDEGYWENQNGNIDEQLEKGALKFVLYGKRLKGKWALIKLKEKEKENKQDNWILIKEKDEYVQKGYDISIFSTSIRSGRTMMEIEVGAEKKTKNIPFKKTEIQLAKLSTSIPDGDEWIYEIKYDGYRIIAYIEDNNIKLITKNGHNYNEKFKEVSVSLSELLKNRTMVLDGEMTVVDSRGKTDFGALQNYIKSPKNKNLVYFIFDILALDGEDLRQKPLLQRKKILESILKNSPKNISYSKHIFNQGKEFFQLACQNKLEGIIGKKKNSIYSGTRNGDWIKCKCYKRQEFVIGGYSINDKTRVGLSSLIVGYYHGEDFIYAGRVGTGFSEAQRKEFQEKFAGFRTTKSAFVNTPKAGLTEKLYFIQPNFVAEISFAEFTKENQLRQASFKGLRIDKNPKEVKKEIEENENGEIMENDMTKEIKITHPEKILFDEPIITKGEVIAYYKEVSNFMMPYIKNRILSIVRCPNGINGECFFKKHPDSEKKGIMNIPIKNSENETKTYFYIDSPIGLLSEAQMGSLEFHTWGSNVDTLEQPDIMVFDLDPDEGMDIARIRQGVKDLKSILDELKLKSYLKTSGGKGYHVVVYLAKTFCWEEFHNFAKHIAQVMEQKWPEKYTSNVRKENRKNRIFIDWMRNGRGATSVAPYSLRARKGATVSTPIFWDELDKISPNDIGMKKALERIKGRDPWSDFFKNK